MRPEDDGVSVDRMDHASRNEMAAIAIERGQGRGKEGAEFYGWAILQVREARGNGRTVEASPLESNRYHADIHLNLSNDAERRDEQKRHALELAVRASWEEVP